ncbi:mitochondrial 54S ribosomal protein mL58 [Kwoniella dejecticola CBS 10117]|uniref:Uncharacterized protein n=1 Tax=Kwoniella dejecticola CBS 10117 TaxID=1296121 RepID=A0A1A5ZYM5_9TREE|nr:uncharacterized protein I303_06469 [Kwoniella dejecticola CBS 10117]OBR82911.1 hypothetical protein I303_06469 [Kwoniella dejecticola CBS 10117]
MAAPILASSSRAVLSLPTISKVGSTRGVLHRARPPRIPKLNSPHTPKEPLPTSGTSHPVDPKIHPRQNAASGSSSVLLEDTGLTFHHSPPPSAPSYTNGAIPPLLQWLNGKSISLSGEEKAPKLEGRRTYEGELTWTEEVVERMQALRAEGKSRKQIGDALQLPQDQYRLISRVAPQTTVQKASRLTGLEAQKATWGYRKKLARAVTEKRKEFW